MEKPTVGPGTKLIWCKTQRWTLTGERSESGGWRATGERGARGNFSENMLKMDCCEIIGPSPEVSGEVGKPMEEMRFDGIDGVFPARCFVCSGDKNGMLYSCDPCCNKPDWQTWRDWQTEWDSGKRNFPRPPHTITGSVPAQSQPPVTGKSAPGSSRATTSPDAGAAAAIPAAPIRTAHSILQAKEQARQEKREEDARAVAAFANEWDLLRDA